jgi:L-aminopeptidase/D-esterase-like protein
VLGTIKVGHASDQAGMTGCTVFLLPDDAVASCDVRGGGPGTRETELLRPLFTVRCPSALLLAGGSAFGLQAAGGVVRFLEEAGIGFPTPAGPVPIVSSAVIYDLDVGDPKARPDESMAYRACREASVQEDARGSVGVGTGASAGNVLGRPMSTRGGFGTDRFSAGELKVDVSCVVNSFGDVVAENGEVLAGVRDSLGAYIGAEGIICASGGAAPFSSPQNTTLVVVATNAKLDVEQCARVALQGHNGIARAIRPSHTRYDGDTVFAIATGEVDAPLDAVEAQTARGCAAAIRNAVMEASGGGGLPCACDILGEGRAGGPSRGCQ